MIDKRLFKELARIKGYWPIQAAVSIAAVFLAILQYTTLGRFIDGAIFKNNKENQLVSLLVLFVLFFFSKAAITILKDYYGKITGGKIKASLKKEAIKTVIGKGTVLLRQENSTELASVILSSVDNLEQYFTEFIPHLVYVGVSTPIILLYVFYLDPISAIIMAITAPLIPVFMILIGKTGEYVNKKQWHTLKEMNGYFSEVLKGLMTLKLFSRIDRQVEKMKELDGEFRGNTMSVLRITFLSALVLELLTTLSTAVVAVSLGVRLLTGHIDFYSSFLVLLLTPEYFQPLRQMGAKYHIANNGKLAANSLYGIIEESGSEESATETIQGLRTSESKTENRFVLEIENLKYSYNVGQTVLDGINLSFEGNKLIAIAGDSGVGKTTLSMLIMGYDKNYEGLIKINDMDIKKLDSLALRAQIAYVPQKPVIFNGTLLENIKLGNEDASKAEIEEAISLSGMKLYIEALPNGINTVLGEGGHPLSGGQNQMISICRAILKKTNLVILDEPASALDVESEEVLAEVLIGLKKKKAIIIIAHRISTLALADHIFYMENGEISEQGSHRTLLKNNSSYGKIISEWGPYFD